LTNSEVIRLGNTPPTPFKSGPWQGAQRWVKTGVSFLDKAEEKLTDKANEVSNEKALGNTVIKKCNK
jgi:hypothetical protein